jgi:hypothetical protein
MITGKGFWIWKLLDCEGGDPERITSAAQAAGLSHVLIKIADGTVAVNEIGKDGHRVLLGETVTALKAAGIQVWGWHYVYGYYPQQEADIAIRRTLDLGLDGYVIDAEGEFKQSGWSARAESFAQAVRRELAPKGIPIALSSYRYPSQHREFPWEAFLEQCDLNMPQVYWEQSHNVADQLRRCVQEFSMLSPVRPVMPVAPTYKTGGWAPTPQDMKTFLDAARELNIQAVSFFSWDECRRDLPTLWDVVAAETRWPVPLTPAPEPQQPPEGNMIRMQVVIPRLNIRSGPAVSFTKISELRRSDIVNVEAIHVESPTRVWAKHASGWSAVVYDNSMMMREVL